MLTFHLYKQNKKGVDVLKVVLRSHLGKGVVNFTPHVDSSQYDCRRQIYFGRIKNFLTTNRVQNNIRPHTISLYGKNIVLFAYLKKSIYWKHKTFWQHTGNYPGSFKSACNEALYRSYCELFFRVHDLFLKRFFDLIILNHCHNLIGEKIQTLLW